MKNMEKLINYLKVKKNRISISFYISIIAGFLFSLYNGYFGIKYRLVWNFSMFFYYLIILLIRILISFNKNSKIVFNITHLTSILITLILIFPAILMIRNERIINSSTIPAIAIAAYTTYKIVMVVRKYLYIKKSNEIFEREILILNVIECGASILTLQNTLIVVTDGYNIDMVILSIVSSITILLFLIVIIIVYWIKNIKNNNLLLKE